MMGGAAARGVLSDRAWTSGGVQCSPRGWKMLTSINTNINNMMNSAERRRLELLEREKDPDMDLVHMERLAEHHAQEFMTQLTKLEQTFEETLDFMHPGNTERLRIDALSESENASPIQAKEYNGKVPPDENWAIHIALLLVEDGSGGDLLPARLFLVQVKQVLQLHFDDHGDSDTYEVLSAQLEEIGHDGVFSKQEFLDWWEDIRPYRVFEQEKEGLSGVLLKWCIFSRNVHEVVHSWQFRQFIMAIIVLAGVLVGLQTYESLNEDYGDIFHIMDAIIVWIFLIECVMKILSEGLHPLGYLWESKFDVHEVAETINNNGLGFMHRVTHIIDGVEGWNCFDFCIVVSAFMPFLGNSVAVLRILRLTRVVKLLHEIEQLQVIMTGLVMGLKSIFYIAVVLLLLFYLFAICCIFFFRDNDMLHFGTLGQAFITLFRMATLEDWTDVMYTSQMGCLAYYFHTKELQEQYCPPGYASNAAAGFAANIFFVFFIVVCALVVMSLFVGVITTSMQTATSQLASKKTQKKAAKQQNKLMEKIMAEGAHAQKIVRDGLDRVHDGLEYVPVVGGAVNKVMDAALDVVDQTLDAVGDTFDADSMAEDRVAALSEELQNCRVAQPTKKKALMTMYSRFDVNHSGFVSVLDLAKKACQFMMETGLADGTVMEEELAAKILRMADGMDDTEKADGQISLEEFEMLFDLVEPPVEIVKRTRSVAKLAKDGYQGLANIAKHIVNSKWFSTLILICILICAIMIGLLTYPLGHTVEIICETIDGIILVIFILECGLKIVSHGFKPFHFFRDNWNTFDFCVIVVCLLPFDSSGAAVLRLLRLLRVMKMFKSLPQLQIILNGLASGVSAITYVGVLMLLLYYLYAILGITLFRENDPTNFGDLHMVMVVLFRCATMEDWTDVMYVNMYGCDVYYDEQTGPCVAGNNKTLAPVTATPHAQPIAAPVYFITFEVFSSLIILNLVIGTITASMQEETEKFEIQKKEDFAVSRVRIQFGVDVQTVDKWLSAIRLLGDEENNVVHKDESATILVAMGWSMEAELQEILDDSFNSYDSMAIHTYIETLCRDYVTKMERLENQLMEMFYNRMVEFDTTGTLQHKRKLTLPKNGGESDVEGAINGMIGSMVSVDMEQPQSPSEGQDENELDNPLFGGQTVGRRTRNARTAASSDAISDDIDLG